MQRPIYPVLLCAILVTGVFVATGHLTLGGSKDAATPVDREARVAGATPRAAEAEDPAGAGVEPRVVRRRPTDGDRVATTARLFGTLFDALGFDLADAAVTCGPVATRSDREGAFAIDAPTAGAAALRFAAPGHRPRVLHAFAAGGPLFAALEPRAPWDEEAPPAAPLDSAPLRGEGFVRDADGAPLADALVFALPSGAVARTDAGGRYEIDLPSTPCELVVHAPDAGLGFAVRSAPLAPSRASGRVPLPELRAAPAVAVRGTVRDARGEPQPNVPIQVVGSGFARTIATGKGGVFRLAGLLPGDYQLRTFAWRGALGAHRAVRLDARVTDCELHLRSAPPRRLRVVTPTGEPVAQAFVATTIDGLRREVARGDDDGWVRLRAGDPSADFEVRSGADLRPMRVLMPPDDADRIVVSQP
ncbi:MAG: carboxypeptidase regulatory-like domain-containing protein [Planctomycetota bacterium]